MRQPLRAPETVAPCVPVVESGAHTTPVTEAEAEAHVAETCFNAGPPSRCGVELEWLVHDRSDATAPISVGSTLARTTTVDNGRLTVEPGGQLEYSSLAAGDLETCVAATRRDMARLRMAAGTAGVRLVGLGIDPYRKPHRIVTLPRYVAMERCFDRDGSSGRWMMCSTASVQACLDAGTPGTGHNSARARWRLTHAVAPVLVAAFANSPVAQARPTGWASTRQAIWSRIDASRTAPVLVGNPHRSDQDPAVSWARYALDAKVLCIRGDLDQPWTPPEGLTFRSWIRRGKGRPTLADLDYHLTTLFPPVRPRGYLELRMIDAQRGDGWIVPLAVCATLLDHPQAAQAALAATEPLWAQSPREHPIRRAARHGLADDVMAAAARECFTAAADALPPGSTRTAVETFTEEYVLAGRCPADDVLDRHGQQAAALIA